MIWDCFLYNGEIAALQIRCEEFLNLNVTHVLIESDYTFTGNFKKTKYDNSLPYNIKTFSPLVPNNGNAWDNELVQRNYILQALKYLGALDEDLVIISDVDEIIKKEILINYKRIDGITAFNLDMYLFFLNNLSGKQNWNLIRAVDFKYLKNKTPTEIRNIHYDRIIENAGWHFTYMGGIDKIIEKIESFSHTELNNETHKNELINQYNNCTPIKLDSTFPEYILNNIDKLKKYIK